MHASFRRSLTLPRNTFASIDLSALDYNFEAMSQLSPDSKQLVVIKADAYGNGAVKIAAQLADKVALFAVAFLDEVYAIREAGIQTPILVLQGPHSEKECLLSEALNVRWMLHSEHQLAWVDNCSSVTEHKQAQENQHQHWLKFDTGMHRLGLSPERFGILETSYPRLFTKDTVIATHLSAADEPDKNSIQVQLARFDKLLAGKQYPLSIANSAANIHLCAARQHWNRMGISLYGSTPFENNEIAADLRPVMSLYADVIALRTIAVGESVGYGDTWVAKRETKIATVAIGYGDGYPRHAPKGTPALFDGQRAGLVGRVSMDMLTFDVTDLGHVDVGCQVELWGQHLAINEVAKHIGTIGYELMTRVSARVPRIYNALG